jgi:signal transduction histidine kinase
MRRRKWGCALFERRGPSAAKVPASAEEAASLAHLRGEQLKLLARQATRSPFAILIACAFVAFTVHGYVPLAGVGVWAIALAALLFGRRAYAQRQLRQPPEDARLALRWMVRLAFGNGLLTGAAAPLFFSPLPETEKALLTMILVCWTAGGVATAAAYARAFYAYVAPALLPLAALWALGGTTDNLVLAVLILLFAAIQILFVQDNERVVRESFAIRYENERLLEALERERQEVMLARDRAEEANRAKSRFLAAASHDLRQPLHALSLYSAALKLRASRGAEGQIAEQISAALGSLSTLVDSLLDISKLDAGAVHPQPQRMNVRTLIERIEADYRPVARAKGLEFRVAPVDVEVESDPVLLGRVLRNLVDNALKYTRTGSVALSAEIDESTVRIAVRDTGPGIPEAERERIFEEFYQIDNPERDRAEGLGLGLAIVRRLARLLGLRLKLKTETGRGSTFSVRLARVPAAASAAAAAPAAATVSAAALDGARVLVIEDEPAGRVGMRSLLELWGCQVASCGGGDEAERLLEEHALGVDLIVADFRLRQHENGIDTVRRLRARLGEVPALLLTGDTAPERLREAQASGLPLLHKPVSAEKLKETMLAALLR